MEFYVIKRNGQRQIFDRDKLRSGIARALEKRPAFEEIDRVVTKIESRIRAKGLKEVESKAIGREVLTELKKLDKVAYLRFASVYRQFKDPGDFTKELKTLIS